MWYNVKNTKRKEGAVMGLFTLLFALGSTITETIGEIAENRRAIKEQRIYEDIDFDNIESVTLDGTETAYIIEIEEEFDPVMTDFLTQQDGWQHYETQTVEYEIENGEDYCFTIRYKNGTEIYRKFHESSPLSERLLGYCNNNLGGQYDVLGSIEKVVTDWENYVDFQTDDN